MSVVAPAAYDKEVLYAIRAMFDGTATPAQAKRGIEWLVFNACHIGQVSYGPDMAFLEGQRSIGVQIARLREPEALALIEKVAARPKRKTRQEANI